MKTIRIFIFLFFIPLCALSVTVKNEVDSIKTNEVVDSLNTLVTNYLEKDNFQKILEYYFIILDVYEKQGDMDNIVLSFNNIIGVFIKIKDFELAEKYLGYMTQLAAKMQNPDFNGRIFTNKAQINLGKGELDKAINNLYLAIYYFHKGNKTWLEARVYRLLGDVFLQKKENTKALYAYKTSTNLFFQTPDDFEIAVNYTRIAHIYQLNNDHQNNLSYNLKALHLRERTGSIKMINNSYVNVGGSYWQIGRKDSARIYIEKALQMAEQNNNNYLLEIIYKELVRFSEQENNYKQALYYTIKSVEHRNKYNHEQNDAEIALLVANHSIRASEATNELLAQEKQIRELQFRNRRIKTILYEIIFLAILAVVWFIHTLARHNRKRKYRLQLMNDRLQAEIQERTEAEERLHRSEELHRFLAENTADVISLLDANLRRIYISPSCEKKYGYTAQEILQMTTPLDLVEPSFRVNVNYRFLELFRSKNPVRYNYKALRKDGSTFWAEASINPILESETGEIKEMITVVRDISEQMQHEEELAEHARQKEFLLREIHNRVKNNFAILNSLMTMQRDQSDDQELSMSLSELQLRVRTMSLVHEQLYSTQDISTIPFDDYLKSLSLIISSAYKNNKIRLETDIRPCTLSIEMALPMGLIINELMTNSFKYAFPDNRSGTVSVKLLPEDGGKYSITICDDGIGLPEDFSMKNTKSMGSQIVQILAEQLEASIAYSKHPGACFHILFSAQQEN